MRHPSRSTHSRHDLPVSSSKESGVGDVQGESVTTGGRRVSQRGEGNKELSLSSLGRLSRLSSHPSVFWSVSSKCPFLRPDGDEVTKVVPLPRTLPHILLPTLAQLRWSHTHHSGRTRPFTTLVQSPLPRRVSCTKSPIVPVLDPIRSFCVVIDHALETIRDGPQVRDGDRRGSTVFPPPIRLLLDTNYLYPRKTFLLVIPFTFFHCFPTFVRGPTGLSVSFNVDILFRTEI